jgi:hypothetical protein
MLFSAAIQPPTPLRNSAAAEFVRRLASGTAPPAPVPAPVRYEELPAEPDERVRLVGEW